MNFKFRVWHIPSKKFVQERQSFSGFDLSCDTVAKTYFDDGDFAIDCNGDLRYDNFGNGMYCIHKEKAYENETVLSDYVIQRFTGMKDSCGVEVYEGDIVQRDNHTAEVFWNDTIGGFDLNDEFGFQFNFRNLLTMKVVGHKNGI